MLCNIAMLTVALPPLPCKHLAVELFSLRENAPYLMARRSNHTPDLSGGLTPQPTASIATLPATGAEGKGLQMSTLKGFATARTVAAITTAVSREPIIQLPPIDPTSCVLSVFDNVQFARGNIEDEPREEIP